MFRGKPLQDLQSYVRAVWMSQPVSSRTQAYSSMVHALVEPCIAVDWRNLNPEVCARSQTLVKALATGKLRSISDLELKLASNVAAGALRHHPIVCGMLVAVVEKTRRQSCGITHFKSLSLSSMEEDALNEAACLIASSSGSHMLLKECGLASRVEKVSLKDPALQGLPDPFLAFASQPLLQDNIRNIERLLPKHPDAVGPHASKRLILAMDRTYLLKSVDPVVCRLGKGFVGTAYTNFFGDKDSAVDAANGFLPLSQSCDLPPLHTLPTAKEVCEFLCFDPASPAQKLPPFSLTLCPMTSKVTGLEVLQLVGSIMASAGYAIRMIAIWPIKISAYFFLGLTFMAKKLLF